jgi:fructose-bisphosphate aldolase class II
LGIVLEVECGVVGGEEDGVVGRGELYTTTEDLLQVAQALGTGERGRYLLAATFGNVHGVYAPGHVKLRPEILAEGQVALSEAYPGARFQYVFHGGSGSSEEDLHAAINYGVVKLNVDTDGQYAFTRAVADHMLVHYEGVLKVDGGVGAKKAYDPRGWGRKAEDALTAHVAGVAEKLGSASRSLARTA